MEPRFKVKGEGGNSLFSKVEKIHYKVLCWVLNLFSDYQVFIPFVLAILVLLTQLSAGFILLVFYLLYATSVYIDALSVANESLEGTAKGNYKLMSMEINRLKLENAILKQERKGLERVGSYDA